MTKQLTFPFITSVTELPTIHASAVDAEHIVSIAQSAVDVCAEIHDDVQHEDAYAAQRKLETVVDLLNAIMSAAQAGNEDAR